MVLWEKGTATVKELGNELCLDSGTLTPLLKRLEGKKLITRTRSTESDERIVTISITAEGERLKEEAATIPLKISKCVSLPPDEAQTLYVLLYKVLEGLESKMDYE